MVAWGRREARHPLMAITVTMHDYVVTRVMILIATLFAMPVLLSVGACGSEAENASAPPASTSASTATVRIMPLGDSITESNTGQHSYRFYLWHLLFNKGYHVDFVGSLRGVGNGPPADPDFDMNHEGHAGWRADEILAQIHGWATKASPDVVLLHIGHNDLCRGQTVASTISDVAGIIDQLRDVNPRVRIVLAQLIASASTCHTQIPSLNAQYAVLAAAMTQADSPIVLVDQYTGFDPATMTWDGTHPNASGESRMADRWFEKLAPLLDAFVPTSGR